MESVTNQFHDLEAELKTVAIEYANPELIEGTKNSDEYKVGYLVTVSLNLRWMQLKSNPESLQFFVGTRKSPSHTAKSDGSPWCDGSCGY